MEHYRELLHVRFAEQVMGWTDIELSRESGKLRLYGTIHTNRGPQRREVPDYSNDLAAMWGAEQYIKSMGLAGEYLRALAQVTGATDPSDTEDLFRMVSASPAQRCEAGLKAFESRRE